MGEKRLYRKSNSTERLNNAKAEKFELENSVTKGKLVPLDDVATEWKSLTIEFKTAFASLAQNLCLRLVDISDPAAIKEIIQKEVDAINERLAADGEDGINELNEGYKGESQDDQEDDNDDEEQKDSAKKERKQVKAKDKKSSNSTEKEEDKKQDKESEPKEDDEIDLSRYEL